MRYKFRLCFQLPEDTSFSGDNDSVEFLTTSGEPMWLVAIDKDGQLSSSHRFVLSGGSYDSVEEAKTAGEAAYTALLYYAATNRVGIDFGKYESASSLSNIARERLSAQLGVPVLNDRLGLTIYEAEPAPRFNRFHAEIRVGKSTPALVDALKNAYRRYMLASSRAEIAFQLFTISYFENTPSARFLSLCMSLEALFDPSARSDKAQEHISTLIESTRNSEIPEEDRKSLLGALGRLKKESIAQTGKKMADNLLPGSQYGSLPPEKFFAKIYLMRNDLVHRGIADRNELSRVLIELERFVSDILRCQFNET